MRQGKPRKALLSRTSVLASLALLAASGLFAALAVNAGAFTGAPPSPTTITYVCANKSTGQLFYLTPSCAKSQTTVPVTASSTQFKACYLLSNGVTRKVSSNTTCSSAPRTKEGTLAKVPADSSSLYFCVDSSGTMYFKGTSPPSCPSRQFAVVIGPHNQPPVANNDSYSTNENTQLTVAAPGVLANDSDPDGDSITAQLVSGPSHASAFTLNSDGSFSYTPATNYSGSDSFTYTDFDGFTTGNTATVSLTINSVPTVTSTSPADGATNVNAGTAVTINFSESVNATSSAFSLECPSGTSKSFSTSTSPASSFTLTPTSSLPAGTTCTVTVDHTQISSVASSTEMAADYTFSFTVDTPPTVSSTTPADGATDVNAGSTITIDFSKQVTATGTAFSLECPTGTPQTFGTSSSPASSFTLTPTSSLPAGTTCTVSVDHTKITDASSTTMTADYTFSFTVDTPPTVSSTTPADAATDVPLNSTITVDFSKSVSATTSSFTLECPSGTPQTYSLSSSPASSFTLTPTSNLPADTTCTVTVVAAQVTDGSGTNMTADYVFSFHTVLPAPVAVDDGPSTDYSATGGVSIDIGSSIGVLNNDTLYGGSISSYGASTGLEDSTLGTATATAQGGFVTLNANGSFHYEPPSVPPAGGTDTFKYTLTNSGGSDTATVTLNVTHQIIFVDASASSSPETGSIEHPYNSLSDVPSSRNTGGVLFSYSGSYSRSDADGVTLKNSEWLIGQGVALGSNLPFALAPDSVSLPGASTNPTIATSFAGGNAITLGSGNTVKGLIAGSAPGASISGSSFGTLSISSASINNGSSGAGLNLSSGAFGASSSLSSVSASPTGSANGISLSSVTGSLTVSGGSVSANSSGHAFNVSGGSASVTDSGDLSQAGTGALVNVAGGHSGTLTFQTGTLSATGGTGLQFNNADGSYTLSTGSTLNGGDAGVDISNGSSGTMALNSSPITNPSGTGFNVNGSGATVSDSGGISKTSSGILVDIESNTGGSVLLSGNLSATSSASGIKVASNSGGTNTFSGGTKTVSTGTNDAVALTSNTGATNTFSGGGLAVTTSSGAGVKATGGGTVNVTGTGNTISSTTGTALDVESTTIGASGLTFQSISANGGGHGIVLDTTGLSGGLAVTGSGSAGTGGSIQATSGADLVSHNCGAVATAGGPAGVGVFFNSTKSPSLSYMNFTGSFGNFGILGYGVSGSSAFDHLSMTGTFGDNPSNDESAVGFCGLTGSAAITNSSIANGAADNLFVDNSSGSLNRLTLTSDTVGLTNTSLLGNIGTLIEANTGGSTINTTVEDSTFQGSRGTPVAFVGQDGSSMDVVFGQPGHANTVHNTFGSGTAPGTEDFDASSSGTMTFDVNSNHLDTPNTTNTQGGVLINAAESGAVMSGYFRNNTIGSSGVTNSGSNGQASALDIESNNGGDLTIDVDSNQIYQFNGALGTAGVWVIPHGATTIAAEPTVFNMTFTNNTIAQQGTANTGTPIQGFQLDNETTTGSISPNGEAFTTCLKFSGNTVNGAGGGGAGGDVRLRQRFDTKVDMPGYTGAADGTTGSPTVAGFIQGLNPTGPPSVTSTSSTAGGGGFFNTPGGAACALPGF